MAARRGSAEGGLVGGYGTGSTGGIVQALGLGACVRHDAVRRGQQLVRGEPSSSAMAGTERAGQGRTPMRNFLVPHSTQTDRVAGRPFFMVTASMSLDAVLALHLTQ